VEYTLISPRNGEVLRPDGDHLLTDGSTRWPVVDGIPFLRDKEGIRKEAVRALENEDTDAARRVLLADQDRFSPTPPPEPEKMDYVVQNPEISLREAMRQLNYGPVGDYFAYRWCSPTFTGGLNMLERTPHHLPVIEVACGIGHFLRALEGAGREVIGVDIVWSKLWLARRYLGVKGLLVCGDIERSPVVETQVDHTVFCHDAFYFFEHKDRALEHMRKLSIGGSVAIGHVHTRTSTHGAGFAQLVEDYRKLTDAFVRNDTDYVLGWYGEELPPGHHEARAVGWIENKTDHRPIDWIDDDTSLTPNPLLGEDQIDWPSEGWRQEYEEDSAALGDHRYGQLVRESAPSERQLLFRQRRLLNLPPRW
jgi:SAM-dependent methyltransferase